MLFQILDEEGETWGELLLQAGSSNALETKTSLVAEIGLKDDQVQIYATGKLPMVFPQSWVRGCMTLDTATGMARIVVDGKMLEDAPHPKLKNGQDADQIYRCGRKRRWNKCHFHQCEHVLTASLR